MIRRAIHQEDTTMMTIYAPNAVTSIYVKQILIDLKGVIDNIVIGGYFITLIFSMDTASRQKINMITLDLNHT